MLLVDLLKEYKYDIQVRNYSQRTIKTCYNSTLKFFNYCKSEFEVEELEDVLPMYLKKYISYLQGLGRSEVYINSIIKYLRGFFKYCVKEEYISEKQNITKKVGWLRQKKTIINTFNDKEAQKMLNVWDYKNFYNARNKAIISTLFETGIRNYELCTLRLIDVRDTVIKVTGKGNKERVVPISPALKKILIKYDRIRAEYIKDKYVVDDYYFLSYRSKMLTVEAVERVVRETGEMAKVRAEIRCSPHTMRHFYCQFLLRQGVDSYTISRLVGHSNTNITKIYLQSLDDEKIVEMGATVSPMMILK
ncbi:tyrosine-type recombinase/integrase [Clostridium beijerinckii]|uniref:tyrosine-type recombinase/integrase n=1 Tax=Clostridium beijerinckii TaxID=1520 RepID=UPI00156DB6CB|nr:tyrosine-type recombinase/integrase [Clostridium beijerinckii]NRT73625.1 integrase/recombinase XerD [Clostridium beijerinckii]